MAKTYRPHLPKQHLLLPPSQRDWLPESHLGLVARARIVLTDSGGIQEETTVLHVSCLTLRQNAEPPITYELRTNILAGTEPSDILHHAMRVLNAPPPKKRVPEKWDGRASGRIADVLLTQVRHD